MFKEILLEWFQSCLIGVGCSLLATAFVGLIGLAATPWEVSLTLVTGMLMLVADLIFSVAQALPKGSQKGE